MSRFKILILATFVSLPAVALLWSDPQYLANAHDGHEHKSDAQRAADLKGRDAMEHDHKEHDHKGHDHEGHDHEGHDHEGHDHEGHDHERHDHGAPNDIEKSTPQSLDMVDQPTVPKSEPPVVPLNITDNDQGQEQSGRTGPSQSKFNHGEQTERPHGLRVIAIRLEYASEIVRDEIEFDVHCYDRDDLLDAAHMLENGVQQFRDAIESGVDLQGLRAEFQRLTNSFELLAHPLERHYGSILISRSMSRVDRLLWEIDRQLRNVGEPPAPRRSEGEDLGISDSSSFRSPASKGFQSF